VSPRAIRYSRARCQATRLPFPVLVGPPAALAYPAPVAPARSQPAGQISFRLRIELEEVEPAVWRRLLVPGSFGLEKLHDIFQVAMGWSNSHLHSFSIGGESYGMLLEDDEDELYEDESNLTVLAALGGHDHFAYEYDFGDSWGHHVIVEETTSSRLGLKHAVCLGGENACPPEDCGGAGGYAELLAALADPSHEEHEDLLEWIGGPFHPATFDLVTVNAELQRIR